LDRVHYDLDEKVVCCIIKEHGLSSYLFGGSCKCAEAYQREKVKNN